jgi:hypothetical protein
MTTAFDLLAGHLLAVLSSAAVLAMATAVAAIALRALSA